MKRRTPLPSPAAIRKLRTFAHKWQWKVQGNFDDPLILLTDLCDLALAGLNDNKPRRRRAKRL